MSMVKYILVITLLVSVIASGWFVLNQGLVSEEFSTGIEHAVTLTADGFVPEVIAIKKGDTVLFTTNTQREFWPASNQHPAHTVYPEFDPDRPLSSHETWSFTFSKTGEWGYHDHLHSFHRGVVIVTE